MATYSKIISLGTNKQCPCSVFLARIFFEWVIESVRFIFSESMIRLSCTYIMLSIWFKFISLISPLYGSCLDFIISNTELDEQYSTWVLRSAIPFSGLKVGSLSSSSFSGVLKKLKNYNFLVLTSKATLKLLLNILHSARMI